MEKNLKSIKAPPGAKRLIESLRNLGYECGTAIADLIDNSLTADASEIVVEIFPHSGIIPAHIVIADNGRGMDAGQLFQAMRYGAFQEYAEEDLGKYGLGLKTASLSQCTELTVASRPAKSRGSQAARSVAIWDLAHVYKTDDWDLLTPSFGELAKWKKNALDQAISAGRGTVVLWSGLDEVLPLLCSASSSSRDRYLAQLIEDVSSHLSMVFHRFMQGVSQDRPKVRMSVCGTELKPWDPFCFQENTKPLEIFKQSVTIPGESESKKATVAMKPYILPREDEFSSRETWKQASGPRNWNTQQGFYFYRNNRLLQAGGWSYLRTPDEHTKLLRVAVNFPASLDKAFALNITKMRAHIPAEIREATRDAISKWVKPARTRYDGGVNKQSGRHKALAKDGKQPSGGEKSRPSVRLAGMFFTPSDGASKGLQVTRDGADINVVVPQAHDCSLLFGGLSGRRGELTKLCLALMCLLEALSEHRARASDIPLQAIRRIMRRHL